MAGISHNTIPPLLPRAGERNSRLLLSGDGEALQVLYDLGGGQLGHHLLLSLLLALLRDAGETVTKRKTVSVF